MMVLLDALKPTAMFAAAVHRRAAHPAPGGVGLVGALLEHSHGPGGHVAQLEPADAGHAARADGVVAHHRLVAVRELAVGQPEHQPVADAVQAVSRASSSGTQARVAGQSWVKPAAAGAGEEW